ncbi:MAG: class I SAM-dependent RNA methyltransferase [Spirochaetales bacterium]|nr:class I SAM-dependent RNA methyltransferase [Spirochaetales bacterium]
MKTFTHVEIKKLVYGGYGLGWSEGKTLFVKNVLSGEVVNVRQTDKNGGVIIAEPTDIIRPAPGRREAPCPYYASCGGCDWQHISYPIQVDEKKNILIESLQRIGKLKELPEVEVFPSPEWEYRVRVQFQVDCADKKIGFFKQNSHQIVDIDQCPLLDPALQKLLKNKQIIFPLLRPEIKQLKAIAGQDNKVATSPIVHQLTGRSTEMTIGSKVFTVHGDSFFQANKYLHNNLGTWAGKWKTEKFFIDMYGGIGFFSCLSGEGFEGGLLIEKDKNQVALARSNMKRNGIKNVQAIHASVNQVTDALFPFPGNNTTLIIDPPRIGLTIRIIRTILTFNPKQIIYISCNPATQARDVEKFMKQGGYSLTGLALFDQYPNTQHIECGVILNQ